MAINLTLEDIVSDLKNDEKTTDLVLGDYVTRVKTELAQKEKSQLVENVIENAFRNFGKLSPVAIDSAFKILFMQMLCPDFNFPVIEFDGGKISGNNSGEVLDEQLSYDIVRKLDFAAVYSREVNVGLYDELVEFIKQRLDYEIKKKMAVITAPSATDDALESVAAMGRSGLNFFNKFGDIIDGLNGVLGNITPETSQNLDNPENIETSETPVSPFNKDETFTPSDLLNAINMFGGVKNG